MISHSRGIRFGVFSSVIPLMMLAANVCAAQDRGLGFVFEGDLEYGGDRVATVSYEDGSTQDVRAGQGLSLAVGAHYRGDSPFSIRGTVGYKYVTTAASNADINLSRVVFEVLGNYAWENGWWVGVGVTHHTNIHFKGDGFGPNIDFDDATGPTFELGWRWIALSYTKLDYTSEFGGTVDASSLGLTLVSKF
ncbi:MAG TPA: hypothetical protein VFS47_03540 [Steroidobacteraceae bacterium]|nr:hypothetical protein [Steroidobacteraceae bacterium]